MSDDGDLDDLLVEPPPINREVLEALIGTKVTDITLYQRAFTHKSALKRYTLTHTYETLEFMGDSVLGFIVTKMLFDKYESRQEGFLTKARTKLVRGTTLAEISRRLGLHTMIYVDKKAERNGWAQNPKLGEDVFEALIGAIYLDLGLVHAKRFILNIFENLEIDLENDLLNAKDQLLQVLWPFFDFFCIMFTDLFYSLVRHEDLDHLNTPWFLKLMVSSQCQLLYKERLLVKVRPEQKRRLNR
jgi:ribonuclease-3